jgi:putative ATPase
VKAEGKAAPAAYKYPHDYEGHHVDQEYVPTSARYYQPGGQGYEEIIRQRLKTWEAARDSQPGS